MGGTCCSQVRDDFRGKAETLPVIRDAHRGSRGGEESLPVIKFTRTSTISDFPTLCLPMMEFLCLERMQPHEAVFHKLIEPTESTIMHFISHEWLGFEHPDPDGTQLQRMQQIFKIIVSGHAKSLFTDRDWPAFMKGVSAGTTHAVQSIEGSFVERDQLTEESLVQHVRGGCVWLDYHSIPQGVKDATFMKAVRGIPSFVERCDYFWVCAPTGQHSDMQEPRDFASWRRRGWCRLEETINLLSKTLKMPLIVTNQKKLSTYGFFDGLQFCFGRPERSVFNGEFTCCHFDHRLRKPDGTWIDIPCDKDTIGPILKKVFEAFLSQPSKDHNLRANVMRRAARFIFAGYALEEQKWIPDPNETVELFLDRVGYGSIDEVDGMGWTPLMWAMNMADMSVVRELIRRRPAMLYTTSTHSMTVLMRSVFAGTERLQEFFSMFDPLDLQKMVNHRSNGGNFALDQACRGGFHEVAKLIIEAQADVDMRRKDNGATSLMCAAAEGYPLCCKLLLDHGADPHATNDLGFTALHLAAHPLSILGNLERDAKLKVMEVLLEAKASVNALDNEGRTALQVAKDMDFPAAIEILSACP